MSADCKHCRNGWFDPKSGGHYFGQDVECVQSMDSDWFFGKYGFVLREAFPVPLIPCRGQLGFFMPPADALQALASALRAISKGEG